MSVKAFQTIYQRGIGFEYYGMAFLIIRTVAEQTLDNGPKSKQEALYPPTFAILQ